MTIAPLVCDERLLEMGEMGEMGKQGKQKFPHPLYLDGGPPHPPHLDGGPPHLPHPPQSPSQSPTLAARLEATNCPI
ncbi:hypothetical protein [Laspinema olomoucense]|uniref:Uncharacterized protein n=1 Tax=Laspinema olomoucense D3b TaxID=2953688 RepID=A0ABT2N613_9CYAN|nr:MULTISPECIES: hypothetical protein [unclassified Laspinema]MCT7977911.1 hypothetical protein [Laspinema sp. D3b]MCT7986978.1 hypothetical protein [Laspinema sp. D3a]MCT7994315.1 hypothetical protein [Laspinema sp. D3c]